MDKQSKKRIRKELELVQGTPLSVTPNIRKDNLLIKNRFYVVNIKNLLNPRYLGKPFETEKEAQRAIEQFFKTTLSNYTVEMGEAIAYYGVPASYKAPEGRVITLTQVFVKYDYPKRVVTTQQKKNFRTMHRMRMRAWDKKLGLS